MTVPHREFVSLLIVYTGTILHAAEPAQGGKKSKATQPSQNSTSINVPARPVDVVLCRPTSDSVTLSVLAYTSGTILPSSGHLRVHVAPEQVTVEYVRACLPEDERPNLRNADIGHSYRISGRPVDEQRSAGNRVPGLPRLRRDGLINPRAADPIKFLLRKRKRKGDWDIWRGRCRKMGTVGENSALSRRHLSSDMCMSRGHPRTTRRYLPSLRYCPREMSLPLCGHLRAACHAHGVHGCLSLFGDRPEQHRLRGRSPDCRVRREDARPRADRGRTEAASRTRGQSLVRPLGRRGRGGLDPGGDVTWSRGRIGGQARASASPNFGGVNAGERS